MRSVLVPITERKRKSSTKEKVVKDKGKTLKRKSVAASTIDLEEDYVNQCKVEVYYIRQPQLLYLQYIFRLLHCQHFNRLPG
jgi:hypothetical protein